MPNRSQQTRISAALALGELNALRTRLHSVDLKPGEMHVAEAPTLISTVLGSCVSVCLYSPEKKIGAMCHCILPTRLHAHMQRHNPHCCVDSCVDSMVAEFSRRHKVPRATIKAKIFGGANVLENGAEGAEDAATIGHRNIEAARQALQDHELPLVAECVGGDHGYKVFFNTETGEVLLRRVKNSRVDDHEIPAEPHRRKN